MKEKTFLALDRSIFEKFEGLSISLKEPEKLRKEPVLNPESPCSPDSFKRRYNGSVIFHDGLYRMWYIATDKEKKTAVAYAESIDGINWNKPELELVDYKGSKKNNLVSGLPGNTDCISVIKDDDGLFKAAVMNVHGLDK
jgi:hypothetical protein